MGKKIAIYGKGGIGKSIIGQNIAAAAANIGKNVVMIGCDPKCDSTIILTHGEKVNTVLNTLKEKGNTNPQGIAKEGYKGIKCIEVGGPKPGVGCAGRGIIVAIQELLRHDLLNDSDLIIFDVPGDVVCGGFAVPIRKGYAGEVYIVTSGEYFSIFAANNICKGIKELKANLAGIIGNSRSFTDETSVIKNFTKKIGSPLLSYIPHSEIIKKCEKDLVNVFEIDKRNEMTVLFEELAKKILNNNFNNVPNPLSDEELKNLFTEGRA